MRSLPELSYFPRNRRGGVLFRFYTGSAASFASFCCKPSSISPSTPRIDRSRLQTANGALKSGIRLDLGKSILRHTLRWARQTPSPAPSVVGTLGASRRFGAVLRGFRHRFCGRNGRSRLETSNGASISVIPRSPPACSIWGCRTQLL